MFVEGGQSNTFHWVEIEEAAGKYASAHTFTDGRVTSGFIYRTETGIDKMLRGHNRTEKVEWEGTPQSHSDGHQNDVMKSGDIRGKKNDLINGGL
jgi:hypothetical protein